MWGAAIITFREVFEIAIILCVVLAATKDIPNRNKWINLGIFGGMIGAGLFALLTETVSIASGTAGKLYFNAGILFVATAMIMWTVIWMKQHSRTIVGNLKQVSQNIASGNTPLYTLATVIGLAVMREGSEIVVFLYGMFASGEVTWMSLFSGAIVGIGMGTIFGFFLYHGLLRISIKYTFQIISILLSFIAAGMAANAAGKLVKAGLLPIINDSLWNTSAILPQHSMIGRFMPILFGYQENPNGMQALFYIATIGVIYLVSKTMTMEKVRQN